MVPNAGIWKRQSHPATPFVQKRLFPVDCTANCDAALHPSKVDMGTVWLMPLIWSRKENASLVHVSAVHPNFNFYFPLLHKKKSTLMISSSGFRSSPKIFFPHFSCSPLLDLLPCSISCTHQTPKSLGMVEMHFSWKTWLAHFPEGVRLLDVGPCYG